MTKTSLRYLILCLAILPLSARAQDGDVLSKQYDDGGVYEGTFKEGVQHGTG
ncbi:MAG: 2-isopropylmalate synthase, partial [Sulfitobacter sp. SK025]